MIRWMKKLVASIAALAAFSLPVLATAQAYDPITHGIAVNAYNSAAIAAGQAYNVLAYGAKCDGQYVNGSAYSGTGITTNGTTTATVPSGQHTTADIGKTIQIDAINYQGTITAVPTATTITLSSTATATSHANYFYATDDTAALTAIIAKMSGLGPLRAIVVPASHVCLTDTLYMRPYTHIWGYNAGNFAMQSISQLGYASGFRARANLSGPGVISETNYFVTNVGLHYLFIDGASAQQNGSIKTDVFQLASPVSQDPIWFLDHVYLFNASGDCWYSGVYQRGNRFEYSTAWQCGKAGLHLVGSDDIMVASTSAQNGTDGVLLNGGTARIDNNDIFSNAGIGIDMRLNNGTVFNTATGGTYTITLNNGSGYTTGALAYNASASTVQTALQGLNAAFSGVTVSTPVDGSQLFIDNIPVGTASSINGASLTGGTITYVPSSASDVRITNNSIDENYAQGIFAAQPNTKILGNRFLGSCRTTATNCNVIDFNYTVAPTQTGELVAFNSFEPDPTATYLPTYCMRLAGGNLIVTSPNYAPSSACPSGGVNSGALVQPSISSVTWFAGMNLGNGQTFSWYSDTSNLTLTASVNASTGVGSFSRVTVKPTTVSALPSASTAGAGTGAWVTDSTVTAVSGKGNAVVGGGSNKLFVISDGTNWIIQ